MKRQLLFVHGGGEGAYEEDRTLAASLRDALGGGYQVRCPKMPDEDSPQYAAWRDRIASELAELDGEVSLVGHSLGASILLKYISEERTATPIAGAFLVAAPYWGVEDWEVPAARRCRDYRDVRRGVAAARGRSQGHRRRSAGAWPHSRYRPPDDLRSDGGRRCSPDRF